MGEKDEEVLQKMIRIKELSEQIENVKSRIKDERKKKKEWDDLIDFGDE